MNDKPKSLAPIAIPIHWLMSFIAWWPLFVSGGFSILKNDMKPQNFVLDQSGIRHFGINAALVHRALFALYLLSRTRRLDHQ